MDVYAGEVGSLVGYTGDRNMELCALNSACKRACFRHTGVGPVSLNIAALALQFLRPKHLREPSNSNGNDNPQKCKQKYK